MTTKTDVARELSVVIREKKCYLNTGCRRVTIRKTRIGYACDPKSKRLYNSFMGLPGGELR